MRRELLLGTRFLLSADQRLGTLRNLPRLLLIVAVVGLVIGSYFFRGEIAAQASEESLRKLGYLPVFRISLMSSASVLLPLPGAAVIFLGGALLVPLFVGLVAGAGEALGELVGYGAGYGAGAVVERGRRYPVVAGWMRRHGMARAPCGSRLVASCWSSWQARSLGGQAWRWRSLGRAQRR